MPEINDWALQKVAQRDKRPLQNSMDGTCVIRAVEPYANAYLVGEEFPTDVRHYPNAANLPSFQGPKKLVSIFQEFVQMISMQLKHTPLTLLTLLVS